MKIKDIGEFELIKRVTKRIRPSNRVIMGIGDDAAVFKYKKDRYILFSSDMLIEGKHFYRKSKGYLVGKKSLSVNISDIAAMGGEPKFALISLGVPPSLDIKYVDDLYKGVVDIARKYKIDLVGGDTVCSVKVVIDVAILGEVEKKNLVLRSGARGGDWVFVTGAIGGATRGKHLNFTPRLRESRFLTKNFKVHSMIDISDGLIADLVHILKASKKSAVIYEENIPISKDAGDFNSAVREGEDFELVFTISRREGSRLMEVWPFNTLLSRIGEIHTRGSDLSLIRKDGKKESIAKPEGYLHF